jgi:NodT family efflux transporter outer membrane factor (OMF) lipoprotein
MCLAQVITVAAGSVSERLLQNAMSVLAAAALTACAAGPQAAPAPPPAPAAWQAVLPAGTVDLSDWWSRFGDPLLPQLIAAAQTVSPDLAGASLRIATARAARVAAGAAMVPRLDAVAGISRGRDLPDAAPATSGSAGLQVSWELDLFGRQGAGRDAAQARLDAAQADAAGLHTAVAAETATTLIALRACELQRAQVEADAESRAETARLTAASAQAGLRAPADAALARGSAAQGRSQAVQQRAACDTLVKSLVALTAIDEAMLRQRLAPGAGQVPQPAAITLTTVPAVLLQQRPDLRAASRAVAAAAAEQRQADAAWWPQVGLSGSVGALRVASAPLTSSGSVWTLGPVQLALPLFDGGQRRANAEAARAAYDGAVLQYAAQLRNAVREVETALVALQSAASRGDDADVAAAGFEASLRATAARQRGGLASLFELEDARRTAVAAQLALIDLRRERAGAWIALYRALGGGLVTTEVQAR